jgi:predicted small lipoprotein YifL
MQIKRLSIILIGSALCLSIGGCGKKGRLKLPEGTEHMYPHTYPSGPTLPEGIELDKDEENIDNPNTNNYSFLGTN